MGSTAVTQPDLLDQVDEMLKRIYVLEQTMTDPATSQANQTVIVGPGGVTTVVLIVAPSVPTGITLTPGAFMDNIYVDATWTPPSDSSAVAYEIELAKKVSGSYQTLDAKRANGTTVRWNALEPATTYGFRISSVSNSGVISAYVPPTGYTDVTTGKDSTVPAQTTGLAVFAGLRTLVCRWTDNTERDVANGLGTYKVDVATDAAFTANVKTNYPGGSVTSFSDLTANTLYYVRVAAVDSSGNQGPYSTTVTGTTGQASHNDIAAGIITSDLIAAATIVAGNIAAATITGANIAANTINAHSMVTSTLDTADLTVNGGSIRVGSPPTNGLVINSSGLRAYNGGSQTFAIDSSGNASFIGTLSGTIVNAGTISGGIISGTVINGGTITGATVRTAASGGRAILDGTFGGALTMFSTNAVLSAAYVFNYAENLGCSLYLESGVYGGGSQAIIKVSSGGVDYGTGAYDTIISFDAHTVKVNTASTDSFTCGATAGFTALMYAHDINSLGYTHYASTFSTSSSIKIKKNVRELAPNRHDLLLALRPKTFKKAVNGIQTGHPSLKDPEFVAPATKWSSDEIGFIAEELEEVFPMAVRTLADEIKTIDYNMIVTLLVQGYQSLSQRLSALERV